jgi:crotonobetainyl-CoA:carnitine CoA-transferase CaiB-like acyl-CoA transferase
MFNREKAIAELISVITEEFNSMTDEELISELENLDISYLFGETE